MKRGFANLPLHGGKAPRWLFARMVKMAGAIAEVVCQEFGPEELLARLSDPAWFQAFGCVLGFDWHSSGVTTTVCGALKEGTRPFAREAGLFVAGGKGGRSRRTPQEIEEACLATGLDAAPLVYASRMSAKVDSAALQDGYQIYQHCFLFTRGGRWAVVQQGMNEANGYARRYHWLAGVGEVREDRLKAGLQTSQKTFDFVCEPHAAIAAEATGTVLNMVARESDKARDSSAEAARLHPDKLLAEVASLQTLTLPRRHEVLLRDINPEHLHKVLLTTYEQQPSDFERLLGLPGVGPKTIRSLALISELVYNAPASQRDPAAYSFAHGGKDGHPYPVSREVYDKSIDFLREAVNQAKVGLTDKREAMRELSAFLAQWRGRETPPFGG
ncbi:MAG: DUF763 domain-containing protein [Planctomycetes bacterium]|nr:DUF763 domain-containing protein [Planctomycetota bacterium]